MPLQPNCSFIHSFSIMKTFLTLVLLFFASTRVLQEYSSCALEERGLAGLFGGGQGVIRVQNHASRCEILKFSGKVWSTCPKEINLSKPKSQSMDTPSELIDSCGSSFEPDRGILQLQPFLSLPGERVDTSREQNKPSWYSRYRSLRPSPNEWSAGNCALELSGLLQCWATTSDVHSVGQCAEAAKALSTCMNTTSSKSINLKKTDSINFHLARLGKNFR